MEPEYGVNVSNKYAALGDDDLDPFDLLALYVEKNAKSGSSDKKKSKKVEEKVTAPDRSAAALNLEKSAPPGRHEKVARPAKVTEGDRRVKTTGATAGVRQRPDPEGGDLTAKQRPQTERHLNGNEAEDEKVDTPFGEFGRSRARGRPRARGSRISRGTLRGGLNIHEAADSNEKYGDSLSPVSNDDVTNYKSTVMRTGLRNGRQRGRGRPAPNRGRQFDRQSGAERTRVRPIDKREGAGQFNWGTPADELVGETEEVTTDLTADTDEAPTKDSNLNLTEKSDEATDAAPKERVEELTLDEWKAKQAPRAKPQFNTRKPGEGDPNATWTTLVPLQRDQIEKNESNEDEYDDEPQPRHRKKEVIDIGFSFRDDGSRSQRRFGRGRGSYRGAPRSRGGVPSRRGFRGGSGFGSGFGRGFGGGFGGFSSSDGSQTGGGDGFRNGTLDKSSGGESDLGSAAITKEDRMSQENLFDGGVSFGRKVRGGGFGRNGDASYRLANVPYNLDEESFPELPTIRD